MLEGWVRTEDLIGINSKFDLSSPSDTLAQLVERGASNAEVRDSNPGWSGFFRGLSFMLCDGIV